jgi:predicted nucleotidyltransferase
MNNTAWTADTILAFLQDHADELRHMGVVKLGLFGSYVRGEQRPDSDMDFLVSMRDMSSYRAFMRVWNFLEDNFQLKIDLGEEHTLREEIRPQVLREVRYVPTL